MNNARCWFDSDTLPLFVCAGFRGNWLGIAQGPRILSALAARVRFPTITNLYLASGSPFGRTRLRSDRRIFSRNGLSTEFCRERLDVWGDATYPTGLSSASRLVQRMEFDAGRLG